ncbi:MAG: phosphoglycolate phosphatase [Hyphomicrobiaceae bacterium]|jgi:phosphoglycolate phosphatase
MSDLKLVIFDCDGTLVDSQHLIVDAMNMGLRANGLDEMPREKILSIVGLSLPIAIETLLPDHPPEMIAAVTDGYRDGFTVLRAKPDSHEPLYDGIEDVIEALAARDDVVLGIATGKSIRGVDRLLNHMNWTGRFVTTQTADTNASKPHPEMIETAMREAGTEPQNTIMIGDTTFDMRMALNAGVAALGVSWGYHPVDALHTEGAHAVAHAAAELIPLSDRLLNR